jgi:hypothetical protein
LATNFLVAENAEIKQGPFVASEHGDATPNQKPTNENQPNRQP